MRAQRGMALITAVVLVAIATVLATSIGFASALAARRAANVYGAAQSLLAAEGAEALAAYVLKQTISSGSSSQVVSLDQPWAQPYGPLPLAADVTLEFAQIEDQQGKFNINNLADGGPTDPQSLAVFQRLLALVGLETKWAGVIADWIDSDSTPNFPDGAEDNDYLGQTPQYRTANLPVTSISELLAIPGFGRQRYTALAPYIAALPPGTMINICTAPGVVLDALSGKTEYSTNPQDLAEARQKGCFPTPAVFQQSLTQGQQQQKYNATGTQTNYFQLRSFITIGSARFSLYSLLYLDGAGNIRPILRTFGTE
jgi:general secretion pathway protein K